MAKRRPRARTERRAAERAHAKLAEARLKLAALEPGGSPERPIEVTSASVVEVHAAGLPCAACGARTRVEEHAVAAAPSEREGAGASRTLRVARVRCSRCGLARDVYFRIGTPLAN